VQVYILNCSERVENWQNLTETNVFFLNDIYIYFF